MGDYFDMSLCESVQYIIEHTSGVCKGNDAYYRSEKFMRDLLQECIQLKYIDPYKWKEWNV